MNAAKTQPAGTKVPSAAEHIEHLAGAASLSREALYAAAANVITEQADVIAVLRAENRRLASEVEGLKRHVVAMGKAE
jgi:ribosomal protein L11